MHEIWRRIQSLLSRNFEVVDNSLSLNSQQPSAESGGQDDDDQRRPKADEAAHLYEKPDFNERHADEQK